MEQENIAEILSNMIETKINRRNKEAQKTPRNDSLVAFMDNELNQLELIEKCFISLTQTHARLLIKASRESFERGRQSGLMEAKTGRKHPEYLFS